MIKFGTGGWRAIIADEFTKANIRLLTAGLCRLMEQEGLSGAQVCVGYDRRFLSKESAHWAAEVLAGYGFRPFVINRSSPTPLIMYTVKTRNMPYGMAVTASHNPAIYNGIKIFTAGGRDADQTVTGKIEEQIARVNEAEIKSIDYEEALARGIIHEELTTNEYIDSILSMIDTESIKKAHLKIALDPMYGVSQTSLRTILMTCRCDLEVIHDRHDTLFGGKLPAPNAVTLIPLSNFVVDQNCSLGIATDGDADRLGVIDEKGEFVHPNTLLVLLYYYLVKYRGWQGPCVRNNSTTHLLDRVAAGLGQQAYEVPVGFKYISAKMTETDAVIGGESSGGLAVRGHISGKDGIYAAALLVEMLSVTGKPLSRLLRELSDEFGACSMAEYDWALTPQSREHILQLVMTDKRLPDFGMDIERVSYMDGCKVYFRQGWIIVRFSGTEPRVRIFAEAPTRAKADELVAAMAAFVGLPFEER